MPHFSLETLEAMPDHKLSELIADIAEQYTPTDADERVNLQQLRKEQLKRENGWTDTPTTLG